MDREGVLSKNQVGRPTKAGTANELLPKQKQSRESYSHHPFLPVLALSSAYLLCSTYLGILTPWKFNMTSGLLAWLGLAT
jgi:hypothetical protein